MKKIKQIFTEVRIPYSIFILHYIIFKQTKLKRQKYCRHICIAFTG